MSKVASGVCLGHSGHKAVESKISVDRRKSSSNTSTLDMKRADFRLLRELVRFPWEMLWKVLRCISAGHSLGTSC